MGRVLYTIMNILIFLWVVYIFYIHFTIIIYFTALDLHTIKSEVDTVGQNEKAELATCPIHHVQL